MNNESITFQRTPGHFQSVKPTVRYFHRYNLRFECWKRRKTNCLQFNLFATKEPLAQITQRDSKTESGKRPSRVDVDLFGYILVVLADVRTSNSREKIRGEFALRLSDL